MSRSLDNPINWSVHAGTMFAIRIRIHLFFILGAIYIIFRDLSQTGSWSQVGYGMGTLGLLFAIVLMHEFGHCFGARYVGGTAEEILLWPLGGLAQTSPPHKPRAHLITVLAGPAVNVAFLLIFGTALAVWKGSLLALPLNPFKPFLPLSTQYLYDYGSLHYWLNDFITINWMLLLFNLLPVFPFDGGRVLQCILWFRKGYGPATMTASGVGMVGAIAIGTIGLLTAASILMFIAIFGYVTCWQQRQMLKAGAFEAQNEFGYDFSQGYTSLNKDWENPQQAPRPSFFQRWRNKRAIARAERERNRIEERRVEVDRILEKVHKDGLQSLTTKERRLLQEESKFHESKG